MVSGYLKGAVASLENSDRLDKIADTLEGRIRRLVKAGNRQRAADFLYGTWLGHPLHPVLTDMPIGAWAMAGFLDSLSIGRKRPAAASQAIAFGILMSAPIAASGMLDWHHTNGGVRRVGVAHALLNGAALSCYTTSLALQLLGRGPARTFGFLGLGLVALSAYLGGHLRGNARVGVLHEAPDAPPRRAVPVIADEDLIEGTPTRVDVEGYPVMLYREPDRITAIADTCPHLGCSLSEGVIEDGAVVCACHGSTFALEDGRVLHGPSSFPVEVFKTSLRNGQVYVSAPRDSR